MMRAYDLHVTTVRVEPGPAGALFTRLEDSKIRTTQFGADNRSNGLYSPTG